MGVIGMLFGLVVVLVTCWGRMLGKAIEQRIDSFHADVLGVNVDIDSLRFNPCTGVLEVNDLTVENPKGYSAPYLLRSGKVTIDVDVLSNWLSFGRECHVEKMKFNDLDIVLEKSQSSSNVKDVLTTLKGKMEQRKQPEKSSKDQTTHTKLFLHELGITDIGVKLQVDKVLTPSNMSMRFALKDIVYDDFYGDRGATNADDVAAMLLEAVLKSVALEVINEGNPSNEKQLCNACGSKLEEACKFCSDCGSDCQAGSTAEENSESSLRSSDPQKPEKLAVGRGSTCEAVEV